MEREEICWKNFFLGEQEVLNPVGGSQSYMDLDLFTSFLPPPLPSIGDNRNRTVFRGEDTNSIPNRLHSTVAILLTLSEFFVRRVDKKTQ